MGIELADLPTIYKRSDFITVHTPKTKETANLINKDTIGQMKDGVRIINCARGGIVNETDLYEALKSGKVGAAAFDVFEKEPPENHPLLTLDNFIATPHLGASTQEAQENVATAVAEQVVDYLLSGTVRNAVNVPSVPADQLPTLSPYISLAEKIGLFQAQLCDGGLTEVLVEYSGEVAGLKLEPITLAALKGLLTPILEENVNYVNAPLIAKGRGIEVKVSTSSGGSEYTSLMTSVKAGGRTLRRGDPQQQEGAAHYPGGRFPHGDGARGRHAGAHEQRQARRHRRHRHAHGPEWHQYIAHAVRPREPGRACHVAGLVVSIDSPVSEAIMAKIRDVAERAR
jgi:D-3-phosphoglycerate dehydrogenase